MEITYETLEKANQTIITTDIKGKSYAEVNQRIKAFRMVYPMGFITTEMLNNENGVCVFKATVGVNETILGTGTAYEKENSTFINKTSYIENCETSAVGRALGMAGFGIDTSVASAEEVINAINNQEPTKEDAENYVFEFGKHKGKLLKDVLEQEDYIDWLLENSKDNYLLKCIELLMGVKPLTEEEKQERDNQLSSKMDLWSKVQELAMKINTPIEDILNNYKVEHSKDMSEEQMQDAIKILEKKRSK